MLRCLAGHVIFHPDRAENSEQRKRPGFCGALGFGPPRQNARYGGQLHHRATVKGGKGFTIILFSENVTSVIQHQHGISTRLFNEKKEAKHSLEVGAQGFLEKKKRDLCVISLTVSTIQILGNGLQTMSLS